MKFQSASVRRARTMEPGSDRRAVVILFAMLLSVVAGMTMLVSATMAAPANDRVLILSTSVWGDPSREAQAATALGLGVDVVSPEEWALLTAEDFGTYRAIILGDPACGGTEASTFIGAAEANAAVWGPAVDGNAIIIGTDPEAHGKVELTDKGVALAVSEPGRTGAYITLGCYYHFASPGTPVPALDGLSPFGTFTATGLGGCFDSAHLVAEHPALAGLTDEYLSNWGCAVHEAFDSWPADFVVLAIATTGGAYTASDGTVGTPYILARGESIEVVSDVDLTAPSAAFVGDTIDLTATVSTGDGPVMGTEVTFVSGAGPHAGTLGTAITDGSGTAVLELTGSSTGTDVITASYVDSLSATQTSGPASVTWSEAPEPTATPAPTPPSEPTPAPSGSPEESAEPTPVPSGSPEESAEPMKAPTLDVDQTEVEVEDRIDVVVRHLEPNSTAEFFLHSSPVFLGRRTADAGGVIETSFTVPDGTLNGAHQVIVHGFDEAGVAVTLSQEITVVGGDDLPNTALELPLRMEYWLTMLIPLVLAAAAAIGVRIGTRKA